MEYAMSKTGKGFDEQTAVPDQAERTTGSIMPAGVALVPEHQRWIEHAIADGKFETVHDAVTCALQRYIAESAADDEDADDDAWVIAKIEEAKNDPRPSLSGENVIASLRARAADLSRG
jgi:Arc/MetJ-type ribon-helix-helix transcriptional regulator